MADLLQAAQREFAAVFTDEAYTSLAMIDFLVSEAGLHHRDFVINPKAIQALSEDNISSSEHMSTKTWTKSPGRCTAFAVKVAANLQKGSGDYEFKYYNFERHRAAYCSKTHILIDSGSQTGAIILTDGQWTTIGKSAWIFENGKLAWKNGDAKVKIATQSILPRQALAACLAEVAQQAPAVVLFRSFHNNTSAYHGMISCRLANQRIDLVCELEKKSRNPDMKIEWSKQELPFTLNEEEKSAKKVLDFLDEFVKHYGGPNG
ncbi:hypothetical protein NLG97_g6828 [Lecanicillium saksenae]|uniref:Uncharacterized protein n=1 Tax=Lecanicillium saksenae TaxID=468837 RepID=A0ACC1QPP6_9HYPO|nr:hypothetical protein NLG97_g6828 [Lecanicillium saksenae]